MAVPNGYPDVVALLLENDADTKARDKDGNTPLHLAVKSKNLGVVELLRWKKLNNKLLSIRSAIERVMFDAEVYHEDQISGFADEMRDLYENIYTEYGRVSNVSSVLENLDKAADELCDFWEEWQSSGRDWDNLSESMSDMPRTLDELLSGQLDCPIVEQVATGVTNQPPNELESAIAEQVVKQAATSVIK